MLNGRDDEAGFTLIELLISITILGILMAAVSAAMMVGLSTNASTGTRIDESRDEQFIAAYFSGDAHGAQKITPSGGGPLTCNFAAGGGTLVVEFVGQEVSAGAVPTDTPRTVSYVRRLAADGVTSELHRLVCTGGAANPGPGGDTMLARHQSSTWSAACIGACTGVTLTGRSGSLDYTLTAHKRTT